MRSQKSVVRKSAKKRAQRKDYEKKRNINSNRPKHGMKGYGRALAAGDGTLPQSRKFTESKQTKKGNRKLLLNTIADKTAN